MQQSSSTLAIGGLPPIVGAASERGSGVDV
jgi:hypothetical protein